LQASCLEIFSSTPLYIAAGPLWARAGIRTDDSETARRGKIVAFLSDRGIDGPDAVETLAGLLGVALGSTPEAAQLPPAEVKRRQFALIIGLVGRIVRTGPTLLWIEDTHWLDPSSVELLPQLIGALRETPLLVVLTRRSFPAGPELPGADEEVALSPLPPGESLELARAVPGAQALRQHLLSDVVSSADGLPLFIEQLVISLVSQTRDPAGGSPRSGTPTVPLTLAEMLSERLDRLPGGRRIVQAAACVGRAFTPSFVAALLGEDEGALSDPLEALVGAEILRRQGDGPGIEFEFRHTLLRLVAYESVLQADRRAYHTRIVALLKDGQDLGPALPEVVAHHLTAAGAIETAVESWLAAGTRAARRSAHVEALDDLGRGLGLLDQVRDDAIRRDLEIKLQAARIGPIIATLGSTSAEMGACCHRGLELCLNGSIRIPTRRRIAPSAFDGHRPCLCRRVGIRIERRRRHSATGGAPADQNLRATPAQRVSPFWRGDARLGAMPAGQLRAGNRCARASQCSPCSRRVAGIETGPSRYSCRCEAAMRPSVGGADAF